MIKLYALSLLLAFTDSLSLEQKACDYFFGNIFKIEYPDYKVIEFDNHTDTTRYWGIVRRCENWDDTIKEQITSARPDKPTTVNATLRGVRIKARRKYSGRMKIGVWSKVRVAKIILFSLGHIES